MICPRPTYADRYQPRTDKHRPVINGQSFTTSQCMVSADANIPAEDNASKIYESYFFSSIALAKSTAVMPAFSVYIIGKPLAFVQVGISRSIISEPSSV